MRFFVLSSFVASVVAVSAFSAAASGQTVPAPIVSEKPVATGVRLLQTVLPEGTPGGPLMITVIEVNPKASKRIHVDAALGGDIVWGNDPTLGRENVSALTARTGAVAGINASFFPFAGNPLGFHVQKGEMVIEPGGDRTVFYITRDGTPHFDILTFRGTVTKGTDTVAIDGMNRAPAAASASKNEVLLYTPIFFPTTLPSKGRFEVALRLSPGLPLRGGTDITGTVLRTGEDGKFPIEPNTVVLSGSGTGAAYLRRVAGAVGTKVILRLDLKSSDGRPFALSQVRDAVAGGTRLLAGGKNIAETPAGGVGGDFSTTQHPRSAVGVTADGRILLVLVDGRQKGISRGIGLVELAHRMAAMGCVDALNLDGGGSSALSVKGMVVSSPSGGVERPVASMLLVYAPELPEPRNQKGMVLSSQPFGNVVPGQAINLFPSEKAAPNYVWGVKGGIGFVTQADGVFHAVRSGAGSLEMAAPWVPESIKVFSLKVADSGKDTVSKEGFIPKLTLTPDPANTNRATLGIKIANYEGDALGGAAVTITVTGGKPDTATVTTDGKGAAQVGVTWDAGSVPAGRSATITSPGSRFLTTTVK